jgi:hypothetical protein
MSVPKNLTVANVLHRKIIATGLYDEDRAHELIGRLQGDESAMLSLIGRLAVEAERGGSGAQQGIRALINSNAISATLATYDKLLEHELADHTFPVVTPIDKPVN